MTMNADQFKSWRQTMGLSQAEAAAALDISKSSIELYELGHRRDDGRPVLVPKTVELACLALASGLTTAREKPGFPNGGSLVLVRHPTAWYIYVLYPRGYDGGVLKPLMVCKTLEEAHAKFIAVHLDEAPEGRRAERRGTYSLAVGSIIELNRTGGSWGKVARDPERGGMQMWDGRVRSLRDMFDDTCEGYGVS